MDMAGSAASLDFWILAAGLTLGIAAMLILGLRSGRRTEGKSVLSRDIEIYRAQLGGIERDIARGTMEKADGERLRTEVARRLLEADRQLARQSGAGVGTKGAGLLLPALCILAALGGGVALYAKIGHPGLPDLPLSERISEADQRLATRPSQADYVKGLTQAPPAPLDPEVADLMAKLREAVDPAVATDLRGLELLAYNEARLGNFASAVAAQERLLAVKGSEATADEHATLAEILIAQAQGYVSPESEVQIEKTLTLNPDHDAALYYKGLMLAKAGRFDLAFMIWQPLMARATAEDAWAPQLAQEIAVVAEAAGVRYQPPALPKATETRGPSEADMAAAAAQSPEARQEMILGMVNGLQERLETKGGSAEEWAQLVFAQMQLGEKEAAEKSLAAARAAYPEGEDRAKIDAAAKAAGLGEGQTP